MVEALQKLYFEDSLEIKDLSLRSVILPVSFARSFEVLKKEIDEFAPECVVAMGLAFSREEITVERVGINFLDAEIADNEGTQPRSQRLVDGAPDGWLSDLPLEKMVEACRAVGVKASISNTAGTFVCNALLYKMLSLGKIKKYRSGFVHLPPTAEIKPEGPFVDFQTQLLGVRSMLSVMLTELHFRK